MIVPWAIPCKVLVLTQVHSNRPAHGPHCGQQDNRGLKAALGNALLKGTAAGTFVLQGKHSQTWVADRVVLLHPHLRILTHSQVFQSERGGASATLTSVSAHHAGQEYTVVEPGQEVCPLGGLTTLPDHPASRSSCSSGRGGGRDSTAAGRAVHQNIERASCYPPNQPMGAPAANIPCGHRSRSTRLPTPLGVRR